MSEIAVDDALRGAIVDAPQSWDEAVAKARAIVARVDGAQWELGDLALGVEIKYGEGNLANFAEEIGVEPRTLMRYRWVAGRYPAKCVVRTTHSFSIFLALAGQPDRLELIASRQWTAREARELVASRKPKPLPKGGEPSPPAPGQPSPRNREPRHAEQAWRNVCQAAELVIKLPKPDFETSEKQRMIRQLEAALKHLKEM